MGLVWFLMALTDLCEVALISEHVILIGWISAQECLDGNYLQELKESLSLSHGRDRRKTKNPENRFIPARAFASPWGRPLVLGVSNEAISTNTCAGLLVGDFAYPSNQSLNWTGSRPWAWAFGWRRLWVRIHRKFCRRLTECELRGEQSHEGGTAKRMQ